MSEEAEREGSVVMTLSEYSKGKLPAIVIECDAGMRGRVRAES